MQKWMRWGVSVALVASLALLAVATAGAATFADIAAPSFDVGPLAQGILDALSANLATILQAAGVLAGVFFVLRMARRWFGARTHA